MSEEKILLITTNFLDSVGRVKKYFRVGILDIIDPLNFSRSMKHVRIVKYFMHGEIILNAITSEEIVRPRDTTK